MTNGFDPVDGALCPGRDGMKSPRYGWYSTVDGRHDSTVDRGEAAGSIASLGRCAPVRGT
jgi:hypothetical protein